MPPVSLVSASLAAAALESVLYGVFLILALSSMYFHISRVNLTHEGMNHSISMFLSPIFVGSVAITVTVTGHWITVVIRLFDAFVYYEGGAAPSTYYSMLPISTAVAKASFLAVTLIECDIMLVYRLWTVWNHSYVIAFIPMCTILGQFTLPTAIYHQTHIPASGLDGVFASVMSHWITSGNVFTFEHGACGIELNIPVFFQSVLVTVVESAMLFMCYTIFFLVSYTTRSNLQYFCIDTICPVAGIAFMLINARVGLGWAQRAIVSHHGTVAHTIGQSFAMNLVTVDSTTSTHRHGGDVLEQSQVKTDYGHDA
ncbi:uncharacterized protein B0H18DRAFT_872069 [Fomitopsis serialis]|uniref:uncharacterized protein n=1 Tax=Fomitopsis serialis TaxID=139415 RepID=UPI00200779E0|nr:uncharacterized protein B0H18DRAFT_872069 [Neoantrodia serialis]KAH9931470.1 hypothetical protein B0H18DRAFT_872069 [Neoantrodia serialis]